MTGTTRIEALHAAEAAALRGVEPELAELARNDPSRLYAEETARKADWHRTPEAAEHLRLLRRLAAEGRHRSRMEHPGQGRPPKSPEQRELEVFRQESEETQDDAEQALATYLRQIEKIKSAAPKVAQLETMAKEQVSLCAAVLQKIKAAADDYLKAAKVAERGRAVMRQLGGVVTFAFDPFMRLDEDPDFLGVILKRIQATYDRETRRLGADPQEELAEAKRRKADNIYRLKLDKAAKEYRGSKDGKGCWQVYVQQLRLYEAGRDRSPAEDHSEERGRTQELLNVFYKKVCEFANIEYRREMVPQVR